MSYILDALRKAEMERELSRVPGISSRQQFTDAVSRFPSRHLLLVGATVVFGMSMVWLLTRPDQVHQVQASVPGAEDAGPGITAVGVGVEHEKTSMGNAQPDVRPVRIPAQSADVAPKRLQGAFDAEPAPPVQAGADKLTVQPASKNAPLSQQKATTNADFAALITPPQDEASRQGKRDTADHVVAMIAEEVERDWPVPVSDITQPQTVPSVEADTDAEAKVKADKEVESNVEIGTEAKTKVDVKAAGVDPVTEADGPEEELPPLLRTLPYRFQSTLPKIVINAQAYADEVEARFVIINMKKYREGERTQEGIVVERIDKEHLVLSYQGQAFRMQR